MQRTSNRIKNIGRLIGKSGMPLYVVHQFLDTMVKLSMMDDHDRWEASKPLFVLWIEIREYLRIVKKSQKKRKKKGNPIEGMGERETGSMDDIPKD